MCSESVPLFLAAMGRIGGRREEREVGEIESKSKADVRRTEIPLTSHSE